MIFKILMTAFMAFIIIPGVGFTILGLKDQEYSGAYVAAAVTLLFSACIAKMWGI